MILQLRCCLLFFAFFIGLIAWPNYLAISLPGLPWISIIRLTAFPLTLIFLYCVSVSHEFREKLAATINSEPYLWKALVAVACIQIVSVAFSASFGLRSRMHPTGTGLQLRQR